MAKFGQHWPLARQDGAALIGPRVIWTAVLLTMVGAVPLVEHFGWPNFGLTGSAAHDGTNGAPLATAGGKTLDPLLAFNQRSPGARGAGALVQTKNKAAPVGKTVKPHERVLANVRYAPPGTPLLPDDVVPGVGPFDMGPPPIIDNPAPPPIPSPPIINQPPIPLVPGGPGGGPTPPGGGGTVTPAVPEPATWAMLMLGLFLMGPGLRAAQRRQAKAGSGAPVGAASLPLPHRCKR